MIDKATTVKERNINLDIIRCLATLSVLSVHFFLKSGFYNERVVGEKMFIGTMMRSAFMVCVPLFMMLTGYLMHKKKASSSYFWGIKKVWIIYVLSTLLIFVYKIFYLKQNFSLMEIVYNITSFQQYSWYIEMYIGLYLLIPFLNLIYNNLESKKDKQCLIVVMLILTTVHSGINIYGHNIVPDWWVNIYPITYYFLGTYLWEFGKEIKLSQKGCFILFVVVLLISGTFSYTQSYGNIFRKGAWNNWGGVMTMATSVALFLFLLKLDTDKLPEIIKKIAIKISELSLPIYLTSWIWDELVYKFLNTYVDKAYDRIAYFLPVLCLTILGSVLSASIVLRIYRILDKF